MTYYVPPSEKVGGHVPRVPHQIAPMGAKERFTRGAAIAINAAFTTKGAACPTVQAEMGATDHF